LLCHKEECNAIICSKMDGTEGQYVKWNKADKGQVTYFIHRCGNKVDLKVEWLLEIGNEQGRVDTEKLDLINACSMCLLKYH
jgi:hypothetical protein